MSLPAFAVTYEYRCPFARNAHEHLVAGLRAGAGWEVEFLPFSLSQAHVEQGGSSVWDEPEKAHELLSMESGLVVRERDPDRFLDVHLALFAARHDEGKDLRDREVVAEALASAGADPAAVFAEVDDGWPRELFRKAHEEAVADHKVFGVPTFLVDGHAVFVRLMTRPAGDAGAARSTIDHVVGLIGGHLELNEFKHTSIPR